MTGVTFPSSATDASMFADLADCPLLDGVTFPGVSVASDFVCLVLLVGVVTSDVSMLEASRLSLFFEDRPLRGVAVSDPATSSVISTSVFPLNDLPLRTGVFTACVSEASSFVLAALEDLVLDGVSGSGVLSSAPVDFTVLPLRLGVSGASGTLAS